LGGVLAGALALLFAVVVVLVETNVQYQRDDWRGASRSLGPPATARVIVLSPGSGQLPLGVYQRGLRQLGPGGARVTELDLVALSASASVGDGLATAPRPSGPVSVPPGFHLAGRTYDRGYTILRFTSAVPVRVEVGALSASRIAPGGVAILLQSPGSRP
jgi:hypothetical protein